MIDAREQINSKSEVDLQKKIVAESDNREFLEEYEDLERQLQELSMKSKLALEKRDARIKHEYSDIS